LTHNPYAPPGSAVEQTPTRSITPKGALPFWAASYLSPRGRTGRLFYWLFGFLPLTLVGFCSG
jgi:hypothetical protein